MSSGEAAGHVLSALSRWAPSDGPVKPSKYRYHEIMSAREGRAADLSGAVEALLLAIDEDAAGRSVQPLTHRIVWPELPEFVRRDGRWLYYARFAFVPRT